MSDSPILLTPGPLTTAVETRRAMLRDWGSRDPGFIALTAELRERLLRVAKGEGTHTAVPLQGSGTFVVEAASATLVPPASSEISRAVAPTGPPKPTAPAASTIRA